MKLNKRGHLVLGFIVGAITSLALTFFFTHHVVIDTNTCKPVDVGIACDFHYEGNK
jgi:hypothetical protein